jgi:FtsP/CotA-like multicopper oxidase with cupredoxin domain
MVKAAVVLLVVMQFGSVLMQAANSQGEYLIKQGIHEDGTIEMYSPYFLWHGDVYAASSSLATPLELRAINGYLDITLTVRAVRVSTGPFNYTSRTFCFNDICSAPGPTLYCGPGDRLKITLLNELGADGGISSAGPMQGQLLHPNRTNIFIQGVNLDPALNNPFRYTSGNGDSLVYEYTLPVDVPPGAHWYHSRVHGSAALQVMGGLFGAFIVEPTPVSATADVNGTYLYSAPLPKTLSSIQRKILVLSHIMLEPPNKSIPSVKGGAFSLVDEAGKEGFSNSSLSFSYLSKAYGSALPVNASYKSEASPRDVWLVNGQYQPTLTLQPGEWRVLDIVVASADRIVELEVRTAVGYGKGRLACDVSSLSLIETSSVTVLLYFILV